MEIPKLTAQTIRLYVLAVLSYMGPLCFVPLMVKDSEFVHFHAKQGLVLWAASVVAAVTVFVPGVGSGIALFLSIAIVAFSATGVLSVVLKKDWKLPLVYTMSSAI
ncbi:MAG: hypothetical protein HQM13_21815 [SAR324 cluster bacterium]|nr:hypothetical protein [SAR324 cluster bacterium]